MEPMETLVATLIVMTGVILVLMIAILHMLIATCKPSKPELIRLKERTDQEQIYYKVLGTLLAHQIQDNNEWARRKAQEALDKPKDTK